MADQEIGFIGGLAEMVPNTTFSRRANETVEFGDVVIQDGDGACKPATASTDADDVLGVVVRVAGKANYEEGDMVRILSEGSIFVEVASGADVAEGQQAFFVAGDGFTGTTGDNVLEFAQGQFDSSGGAGELVKLRLNGAKATDTGA